MLLLILPLACVLLAMGVMFLREVRDARGSGIADFTFQRSLDLRREADPRKFAKLLVLRGILAWILLVLGALLLLPWVLWMLVVH
jgi:hypothetical protein